MLTFLGLQKLQNFHLEKSLNLTETLSIMKEPVQFPYQPLSAGISSKNSPVLQRLQFIGPIRLFIVARLNSTILAWVTGQLMNYVQCENAVLTIFLFDYTLVKLDGA